MKKLSASELLDKARLRLGNIAKQIFDNHQSKDIRFDKQSLEVLRQHGQVLKTTNDVEILKMVLSYGDRILFELSQGSSVVITDTNGEQTLIELPSGKLPLITH